MRHPPWRLVIDNYPLINEIPTRFNDMDYNAHINNVAIYQLYDEARVQINQVLYPKEQQIASNLKVYIVDVHVAMLGEAFYPAPVQVATGFLNIGTSSITYGQAMFQQGRCLGLAEAVAVYAIDRKPAQLPEEQRGWLERHRLVAQDASN
ncbi:MAG: acyl-CoA thioesterase [Porticoccaceae bacterium]|jgi:acyl-CoA thioester hydrolase